MGESFWRWYERSYALNVGVALGLFALQAVHLLWLTGDVVWPRLFGHELLHVHGAPETLIVAVDYAEIPALLSVSLVYIHALRRSGLGLRKMLASRDFLYLAFLNTQWLHLFWITDEFVVAAFNQAGTVLPLWLAWVAIGIDYLELPVMLDTARRFIRAMAKKTAMPAMSEATSERASGSDGE